MYEQFLDDCADVLAPMLADKLKADKKHTWRDAPYIHEVVREALEERKPRETYYIPHYSPAVSPSSMHCIIPSSSYYNPYYYAAMMPIRAGSEINMAISSQVNSLDARMRQLTSQINANQMQLQMQAQNQLWMNAFYERR